jgi:hypothetical protein
MGLQVVCAWAVVLLTATSVAAQETPATNPDAKVTVSIRDTAAPPEWELSIPVSVKVAADAEVGRLSMRLVYPVKALKYTSVRATEALKDAGFNVTASAPKITGDRATLALDIRADGQKQTPLPSGTVAIVVFKVAKNAPEKSWPITARDVEAWGALPDSPRLAASASAGKFTVTPPGLPILSCFFYMH